MPDSSPSSDPFREQRMKVSQGFFDAIPEHLRDVARDMWPTGQPGFTDIFYYNGLTGFPAHAQVRADKLEVIAFMEKYPDSPVTQQLGELAEANDRLEKEVERQNRFYRELRRKVHALVTEECPKPDEDDDYDD